MPLQISELLQPIGEDAPGGTSLRYQPIYDQIKQARTEEEELPSGEWSRERKTADYGLVVRLATDALAKKSKDLQIAAWLTEALLKREGYGGLAAGLRLLASLVSDFWDNLYPELDDDGDAEFRVAPLRWLGSHEYFSRAARLVPINAAGHTIAQYRQSRTVGYEADATTYAAKDARKAAIAAGQMTGEEWDVGFNATSKEWYRQLLAQADAALEAVDALDLICQERFGVDAPGFSPLRDAVAEVRQEAAPLFARKLEADPDPVVEEPPPALDPPSSNGGPATAGVAPAPAAGDVASAAVPPPTAAPAPGTRADAEARLAAIARFLRADKPTDPGPYLLLRGFRWGELRAGEGRLDPALLAAPSTEVRTRLKALLLAERWRELLEAGEEAMASPAGRAWLDLQRYTVAACDGLGGEHARIGAAVRSELRALLHDLPALPVTTLADDTPTANGDTLAWLRAEGFQAGNAGDAPPAVPAQRGDALQHAQQLVRSGQPQKAVELLMREAEQERSARGRFLRRSQAATIMVEAGLDAVALPILQQLVEQVQKFQLEEWEESDTVARALGLLYRCLTKLQGANGTTQELYLRICRLDPMYALQLQAGS